MQVFALCAFLILAVFPNFAFAEELQVDRVYASGTTVGSKVLGISLKVPKGYEGSVGGEFFVLSRGEEAMVAVTAEEATLAQAKAYLSSPQDLGEGYYLTPTAAPVTKANTASVACTITHGLTTWPGEATIVIGPHGIGVGVIATASKSQFEAVKNVGRLVAKNTSFKKPFVPKPGKSSGKWVSKIAGHALQSYGGSSSYDGSSRAKTKLTLCEDGTFRRYFSSGGYSNSSTVSVSYAGNSRYYGKWSVAGAKLRLFYNDGDRAEFKLSTNDAGHFLMNGQRWLRADGECR